MPIKPGDEVRLTGGGDTTRARVIEMPDADDEYFVRLLDGEYAGEDGYVHVDDVEALPA